ncbi:hypothetical protein Tco_0078831 [Tanacetum coccineum]
MRIVNALSIDEFFSSLGNVNVPVAFARVWQAVVWTTRYFIWRERNARVFGNKVTSRNKIVQDIQLKSFECIVRRSNKLKEIDWQQWIYDPLRCRLQHHSASVANHVLQFVLSLPWKPSAYSATGKPTPLLTTMTLLPPPPPPPSPPPSETTENDVVSDEEDVKFTLMSNSSGDSVESAGDVNVSVSPSDELFFKGGFLYFSVSRCHLLNGTIFLDDSVWVFGCGSCSFRRVAAYIEWLQSAVKGWGCMFSSANVAANSAELYEHFVNTFLYGNEALTLDDMMTTLNSKEIKERSKAKWDKGEGIYYLKRNCLKNNRKKSTCFIKKDDHPSSSSLIYDDSKVMMVMSAHAMLDWIIDSGVETGDSNVIPDSLNMCDNDIQDDQNDVECDDERVALANLKLDVDENKKIQKQLKKANATLTQELTECKSILAKTSRTLGESNSIRDSCLVALQNKQTEFERYKAFNDRTFNYDKLEHKLNETLGLLAQKEIEHKLNETLLSKRNMMS